MPNPTRTTASIRFGLPADANVTLRIFSVDGRLVRVLADGVHYPRGFHELAWDGRDVDGRAVSAGVFPYRLDASGNVRQGKITVLR
jgi:flagellar hook assembly protein FlgD